MLQNDNERLISSYSLLLNSHRRLLLIRANLLCILPLLRLLNRLLAKGERLHTRVSAL